MEERTIAPTVPPGLGAGAVELLRRLIRFRTVNPPGDEREAQEHLQGLLSEAGWSCELLAELPDRTNLVARLSGRGEGPTLALISHVDTVPAEPAEWTRDPWSGELVDGYVWGRGALDMKDQVAAEVAACLELGRSGWRPAAGDLLLVVAADEETGAHHGAQWLCREHPEKVRADFVVNEGAGLAIEFEDRRFYPMAVGEKGVFRFNVRTRGVAGHGSLPAVGENALLKMAPLLERLRGQPPRETTIDTELFLGTLLGEEPVDLDAALARIRQSDPLLASLLAEPMLGVTLSPTKARASEKDNIIPSLAEVLVDCRVPPEMGTEEVRERVRAVLGEGDHEIEFVEEVVGNRSDFGGPLAEAIEAWVERTEPGAEVLPIVMPGFSDSHWFREAFGATVYGFCPQNTMSAAEAIPLVHGADERVATADVELMASFFHELPQKMLGSNG